MSSQIRDSDSQASLYRAFTGWSAGPESRVQIPERRQRDLLGSKIQISNSGIRKFRFRIPEFGMPGFKFQNPRSGVREVWQAGRPKIQDSDLGVGPAGGRTSCTQKADSTLAQARGGHSRGAGDHHVPGFGQPKGAPRGREAGSKIRGGRQGSEIK